jgi:diguanylate cyclase (GGDEF)-like protein
MVMVVAVWLLAMVSGLSWGRRYTAAFSAAAIAAFIATQADALTAWTGWLQLGALGLTPWLLAAQRARDSQLVKRLRDEEAARAAKLSEAARSLLSLTRATEQMDAQITEITDLYHVTKETSRAMHVKELFAASLDIAPRLLSASGLRLIDLSGEEPHVLRAARGTDGRMREEGSNGLLEAERAIVQGVLAAPQAAPATGGGSTWAPLWREQRPVGVLVADGLPDEQARTLAIVANQLSLQLARIWLYQRVESLAVTDALTGLFVRRHFMERSREELSRSKRHGLSCTLLMADLDHFKQKNDTYGHLVGDVVLRDVARLLARNLRDVDLIARFGGEEFILLLIETEPSQALPIAQRLVQLVAVHPIRAYDELLTQTVSIGLAGFPDHADTLETLIERADQALYAAKQAGRNRVVVWDQR